MGETYGGTTYGSQWDPAAKSHMGPMWVLYDSHETPEGSHMIWAFSVRDTYQYRCKFL